MTQDIVQQLRDRALSFKAPDPLLEQAADEIERLMEVIDSVSGDAGEVVWRGRDGVAEFLTAEEWITKASAELDRLHGVIDTYVSVCEAGAKEIAHLRNKLEGVTEPMPEDDSGSGSVTGVDVDLRNNLRLSREENERLQAENDMLEGQVNKLRERLRLADAVIRAGGE